MAALETGQPLSFQEHLVNSLATSSDHAALIYSALEMALADQPPEGRSRLKRVLVHSMRVAATLRDSHMQLSHLVRGEDLDTRDLRREREAEIYIRIKKLQLDIASNNAMGTPMQNPQGLMVELQKIMNYIREDNTDDAG